MKNPNFKNANILRLLAKQEQTIENSPDEVVRQQQIIENHWKKYKKRHDRIGDWLKETVDLGKVKKVLEIGGRENPYSHLFGSEIDYKNLDLGFESENTIIADITNCPEIESNCYDLVLSVDVFEHIHSPWLAGQEITRILKPGGISFHSTLFSWRYHPCPKDYFRYTPEALKHIFKDLNCIYSMFDDVERRRNIIGKGNNKIKADAFGGWRENWRVTYAGEKPAQ